MAAWPPLVTTSMGSAHAQQVGRLHGTKRFLRVVKFTNHHEQTSAGSCALLAMHGGAITVDRKCLSSSAARHVGLDIDSSASALRNRGGRAVACRSASQSGGLHMDGQAVDGSFEVLSDSIADNYSESTGRVSKDKSAGKKSMWDSAQEILAIALPLGMTNISGFTLNCLSDAMIGRLGHTALSTSTMANSFYGMMGISVIWGGAAGMETLAGQAYGAGSIRMMQLVLLRAMVVCWCLCILIALVWQHAEWLLIKLGQCPVMSAQGAVYLQALVPSLFAYVLAECLQSYFVCQNNVQPTTWAKGVTAVMGPCFYFLLMFKMNMGLVGAAYAYAACKLLNAALLLGYLIWQQRSTVTEESSEATDSTPTTSSESPTQQQQQLSTEVGQVSMSGVAATPLAAAAAAAAAITAHVASDITLSEVLDPGGIWAYLKYGLPSALMTMLEWWAYEVNVIMAGTLPNAEVAVAVLGICLAISGWFYMFPQSIATATCTRISNALGAGDARAARGYFWSALSMVAVQQVVLASVIMCFATQLVEFFCPGDASLLTIALGIVPIVACNTLADGMNVVLNGVLRACGRQALGARLQLCSYWIVGVPLSWLLGVKLQMGTAGFLMAIGVTSFAQATVCGMIVSRFNWHTEVTRSQKILGDLTTASTRPDTSEQVQLQ